MVNDSGAGKESGYNWAALFIKDLDEQARILSQLLLILDQKNPETNRYYYEEAPDHFSNFIVKLSGHLKTEEVKEAKAYREKIYSQVENNPVFKNISSATISGNKHLVGKSIYNLRKLKDILFEFQLLLSKWIEEHKLGTPTVKDITKASVDL